MAEIPSRYELPILRRTQRTGRLLRLCFRRSKVIGLTLAAVLVSGGVSQNVGRGASAPLGVLDDELRSDREDVVALGQRLDPVSTRDRRTPRLSGLVFYAAAENRVQVAVYFAPSGDLTGVRTDRPNKRSDSGDWWTTDQGSLCRRWTHCDAGRVRCVTAPVASDALEKLMASVERGSTWVGGSERGDERTGRPASRETTWGSPHPRRYGRSAGLSPPAFQMSPDLPPAVPQRTLSRCRSRRIARSTVKASNR